VSEVTNRRIHTMYQEVTDKKRKITTQLKEYSSETPE
jgi:hypothetical protein